MATQAALEHGEPWRQALISYLQGNRDHLEQALRSQLPGVRMVAPQATFLAWLDCSALQLSMPAHSYFLERAQVAFSAGTDFGSAHGQWVRLNFGCTRSVLDEAIARMVDALARR